MVFVYFGISGVLLIGILIAALKSKEYKKFRIKEHPLKAVYPLAGKLWSLKCRLFGKKDSKTAITIKKLRVRENAEADIKLYQVKKYSLLLTICLLISIAGGVLAASKTQGKVETVQRNSFGGGSKTYSLEADYKGERETLDIEVAAEKHTEEEIREIFGNAYETVIKKMLGENESQENVSKPLNLISNFEGIKISWEIDDTDVLDYSGNIRYEFGEDESVILSLYMTFMMEDISEQYVIPLVLKPKDMSSREILIDNINDLISKNNDVYEKDVKLPDNINGEKIIFSTKTDRNDWKYLLLALLAVIAAAICLDRSLDAKLKKRNEELMLDFTEIVSKLSLLHDAGLSIYRAWERIVSDYDAKGEKRFAYQEMKLALEKIKSGANEGESYREFGKRCALPSYIKLGNLLEQNLTKGTKGMNDLLKQEVEDAFEERKRQALKKGEEASTKMLVPMVMTLAVVIAIVAVPALISISM